MYTDEESGYIVEDDYQEDFSPVNEDGVEENFDNYDNSYENKNPNKKLIIIAGILVIVLIILLIISCQKGDLIPSIRILSDTVEIKVSELVDLDVELVNNTNNNVEWSILDENKATVDSNGIVTGIRLGKTKVYAKHLHSDNTIYTDDAEVIVYQGEKGIPLNDVLVDDVIKVKVGNLAKINLNFDPYNAYIYSIEYKSSDETIAMVDIDGNITGVSVGTTQIMVTVNETVVKNIKIVVYDENNNNNNNNTTVPIDTKPTSVKFVESNINIMVSQSKKLAYTILPATAKDYRVKFENSNNTVLRIDQSGNIKGLSMGTSIVTIKVNDNLTAKVTVKVTPYIIYVNSLNLKSSKNLTLSVGTTSEIEYEIAPTYASNKTVTFNSSNTSVATVDTNGLIKAVGAGNCIITVKSVDGNKTVNINVTVN